MTIAGNQPYLFPYIGFWQEINMCDKFIIADNMQYMKQSYITRNNILLQHSSFQFILQTYQKKRDAYINNILVGNNALKILKSVRHAYSKAPYFTEIYPILERILLNEEKNLAKFIGKSIIEISSYLDIDTDILYLSDIQKSSPLNAQDRVIDICKRLKANKLIDTMGGQNLYNKEVFLKEGVQLSFLKPNEIRYKQFNDSFIPNLSIIDVLMFNGKMGTMKLLEECCLV